MFGLLKIDFTQCGLIHGSYKTLSQPRITVHSVLSDANKGVGESSVTYVSVLTQTEPSLQAETAWLRPLFASGDTLWDCKVGPLNSNPPVYI